MAGAKPAAGLKVTMERAPLLAALGHAQSIVERKQTIPILANVLIEAIRGEDGGVVTLTTTNLDQQIVLTVPAGVIDSEGATSVAAHAFRDIINRMPEGAQIGLEQVEAGKLRIMAGRSKLHLLTLSSVDFPRLDDAGGEPMMVPPAALRRLIDRTRFAAHSNEAFASLCGIYLHKSGEMLAAAATDKQRAAVQKVEIDGGVPDFAGTIIPIKVAGQLRRLIEEEQSPIALSMDGRKLTAKGSGWLLTGKLYEDVTFPDYTRIIPAWDVPMEIDATALTEAIGRVAGIVTTKERKIRLDLSPNLLTLSGWSYDLGDATEELACDYDGPDRSYGFNSKFLIDQLQSIDGAVRFYSDEPMKPTRIEIAADPQAIFLLAQMPVPQETEGVA